MFCKKRHFRYYIKPINRPNNNDNNSNERKTKNPKENSEKQLSFSMTNEISENVCVREKLIVSELLEVINEGKVQRCAIVESEERARISISIALIHLARMTFGDFIDPLESHSDNRPPSSIKSEKIPSKFENYFCWNRKSGGILRRVTIKLKKKRAKEKEERKKCRVTRNKRDLSSIKRLFERFNHSPSTDDKLNATETDSNTIEEYAVNNQIEKENENLLYVATRSSAKFLLGPVNLEDRFKKCCVIDLDETLVHSSFKEMLNYDFKVNVEIDGIYHDIFVSKRPHVDVFLNKMSSLFECVLFTASLAKYANPVADLLDKDGIFRWRLFRESCLFFKGGFVKDLSMLGRSLERTFIVDNSPISFMFHPENAIQITSWFDDIHDQALLDLIPYLQKLSKSNSVLSFLRTDNPPNTATFPVSLNNKLSNKDIFAASSIPTVMSPAIKNNPISGIPNKSLVINKSNGLINSSVKKAMLTNIPSIRNFLSRTFTSNTSDKSSISRRESSSVSKLLATPSVPSKLYSNNLDSRSSISIGRSEKPSVDSDTASVLPFNTTVKQKLNSASEVFSPGSLQVKLKNL